MSILLAARAEQFSERTAIVSAEGSFTYRRLLEASHRVASFLLAGAKDLQEKAVAFIAPPGFHYVALQWGIWRAGGIAVPLVSLRSPAGVGLRPGTRIRRRRSPIRISSLSLDPWRGSGAYDSA